MTPSSQKKAQKSDLTYFMIKDAYRSFRKKSYRDAILILEKIVTPGMKNPYPYFLMALSYLLSDKLNKSESVMKKILYIDPDYAPYIQLKSFLIIKSAPGIESLISYYVDMRNRYPDNTGISRALRKIRQVEDFANFQKQARLVKYVDLPKPKRNDYMNSRKSKQKTGFSSRERILGLITVLIILFIAVATIFNNIGTIKSFWNNKNISGKNNLALDSVSIESSPYDLIEKYNKQKRPVFYFSNETVKSDFNRAKYLIKDKKYNKALFLLNRLNNSNANRIVKEKVFFLIKFVLNIDERNFEVIPFEEISRKPLIYKGTAVSWVGRVANLFRKDKGITFNLMVNYRNNNTFDGISDVYSERIFPIKNGDTIEVKAIFVNPIGNESRIYLVAHDIVKRGAIH